MKQFVQKLVDLYAANGKFHSFVVALEFAFIGFFSTYSGGLPTTKDAWLALGAGIGGAVWGAVKGWLRNNVAQ